LYESSCIEMTDKHPLSLLIVGVGGHGRVVADAAMELATPWASVVATDADPSKCAGELLKGVLVLTDAMARARGDMVVHVAIGNNTSREKECNRWGLARCVTVQHHQASVSRFAHVKGGCFIAAQAVVAAGAQLGAGVIVNHGAIVDHDCHVGQFTHIAPHATLGGNVHVGQRVLIGAGAVVLPGCKIGDDVTIGAGAVVTHDIQAPGVFVGVPARKI
jgi:sugar O-acyltransferase (sialic acid O-acetyltransferase NeuD family)